MKLPVVNNHVNRYTGAAGVKFRYRRFFTRNVRNTSATPIARSCLWLGGSSASSAKLSSERNTSGTIETLHIGQVKYTSRPSAENPVVASRAAGAHGKKRKASLASALAARTERMSTSDGFSARSAPRRSSIGS